MPEVRAGPQRRRFRLRAQRSPSGDAAPPDLTPVDVATIYRRLLDREPTEAETFHALANSPSLDELLDVVVGSDEYAQRTLAMSASAQPTVANVWTPELDSFCPPPGTVSPDGVAEVGREGMLFIRGGSNDARGQFDGSAELPKDWAQQWRAAHEHRRGQATRLGIEPIWLVVPDKLACQGHQLAEPLGTARRPVQRLVEDIGLPLLYPVDELRGLDHPAFLRTDSHLTLEGNRAIAEVVLAAADAPAPMALDAIATNYVLAPGDLGQHFVPPLAEVMRTIRDWPVSVDEENQQQLLAVGGHLGIRLVTSRSDAPDPRTCMVFGDSYGFGSVSYQGLSWWLATTFRRLFFVWVPFGWDTGWIERVQPDVVLIQGAERFCVRPPAPDIDAIELAEHTIRRRQGIGLAELAEMRRQ